MQSLTAKVIPLQTRRASRLTTQTFTQSLDVKGRGGEIDMRFHRVALEADGSTGKWDVAACDAETDRHAIYPAIHPAGSWLALRCTSSDRSGRPVELSPLAMYDSRVVVSEC